MTLTTQLTPKPKRPSYDLPRGSMALEQLDLVFSHLPKYKVLPMNGRFGVGRRVEGFSSYYDLLRDHPQERTAIIEVQELNKEWEQKTTS